MSVIKLISSRKIPNEEKIKNLKNAFTADSRENFRLTAVLQNLCLHILLRPGQMSSALDAGSPKLLKLIDTFSVNFMWA